MPEPSILVAGGAGYIGSHMVKLLCRRGYTVTTLDNLAAGYRDAVLGGALVEGDIGDAELLDRLFGQRRFDAVMHFAGLIQVGESVQAPARYYANNLAATLTLLDAMRRYAVGRLVFSSSAAVYGDAGGADLTETDAIRPVNPYGRTKAMVEAVLGDYDSAYSLTSVSLRYFNAAGADPTGQLGERHEPETHLIPRILQAATGQRREIAVFGDDYATPDGTCVRDFVHVNDLCEAHELALRHLLDGGASERVNLGCGSGYSVGQVIDAAARITGVQLPVTVAPRRAGDPARLVADISRARTLLGWRPAFGLDDMIAHAWARESRQPCVSQVR